MRNKKQELLNIIECELYHYDYLTSEEIAFIIKLLDKLITK
jgi:hypothetical protein